MECAHEPCTCQVTDGQTFCSEPCGLGTATGPYCSCNHAECEASPSAGAGEPTIPLG
jgi:hypothetical protein